VISFARKSRDMNGVAGLKKVPKVLWFTATLPDGFMAIVKAAYGLSNLELLKFPSQYQITKDCSYSYLMKTRAFSNPASLFEGLKQEVADCEEDKATLIYAADVA
jgi:hypothetical protein